MSKEYTLGEFLGIDTIEFDVPVDVLTELQQAIDTIGILESFTYDDEDATEQLSEIGDRVNDLSWNVRAMETAIELLKKADEHETIASNWEYEVECKLSDKERSEFEQEQTIRKLKGV